MSIAQKLGLAASIISNHIHGRPFERTLFRPGMTVQIDMAPFILADTAIKARQPETTVANGLFVVSGVGHLTLPTQGAALELVRLYLDAEMEAQFLQLSIDGTGATKIIADCRYFSAFDTVEPGTPGEWNFWLDDDTGMIGAPQFATKDNLTYDRHWLPGTGQARPFAFDESVDTAKGAGALTGTATMMLYQRPTGLATPAPQTEFLQLEAVNSDGSAYIKLASGIDLQPASLGIA